MEICQIKVIILELIICCIITNCSNTNDEKEVNTVKNNFGEETVTVTTAREDFSRSATLKGIADSTAENTMVTTNKANAFFTTRPMDENASATFKEENIEGISLEKSTNAITTENYPIGATSNGLLTTKPNGYDSNSDGHIELEDIEIYLLQNRTQKFLSTFDSSYQRNVINTQLKFCPYTSLCGFSFGLSPPWFETACCKDCSCDFPACMNKKTCCPDIIFNHINMFNSTAVYVDLPGYLAGHEIQKDCISMFMSKEFAYQENSVFGYSTCPINTEAELFTNCTRPYNQDAISVLTDTIPVITRGTKDLYRNKYCAFCNGVLEGQFEKLQLRLSCTKRILIATDKDILNAVFTDGNCAVEFLPEDNLDYCDTGLSKCNFTGGFEERICSMYRSVIHVKEATFQNVFCSICNGIVPGEIMCDTVYYDDDGSGDGDGEGDSRAFSFSGLLKLDNIDSLDLTIISADRCSENELYDTILDSCRHMVCSVITVLSHGECTDIFETLEKITYTTFLHLKPINSVSIADAYSVADDVIDDMRDYLNESDLCGMQMLYKSNLTFQDNEKYAVQNSSLLYFEIRIQYYVPVYHDPYKVTAEILKLQDSERTFWSKSENISLTFKFEIRDNNPKKFDVIAIISRTDELLYRLFRYGKDIEPLNLTVLVQNYLTFENDDSAIFPHLRISDNIGFCEIKTQELNILSLKRCPKINISVSDVPWVETEDGLTIVHGNYVIKSGDYYFVDERHIMLCADQYRRYMFHVSKLGPKDPFSTEAIVSIVCSVVSVLALCFTFFIFCFFSQLRQTLPGKNNMSLIITLLSAQIIYLIGSFSGLERNSVECVILGVLIHFSWLVALFWMNICTFHMFRVLARTKVISHSSGAKRLVIYHVYAVTMAAILVSFNIALSNTMYDNIGYGIGACYISSQEMIIYTFGIPTGVIILSNLFMFIFVIIKIKRSPVVHKNVQNERNDIIVFAKLSTITGVTWTFGFLYTWTNLTAISYLFIIMNASQGVFIMFAFVINKRVWGLFKDQVSGFRVTASERSNPTSKRTMHTDAS